MAEFVSEDDLQAVHHAWSFRQANGFFRKALILLLRPFFRVQRDYNEASIRLISQLQQRVIALENQLRPKLYVNPGREDVTYSPPEQGFHYGDFEQLFHGTDEEIKRRQSRYVPFMLGREAILDVGCGRGQFLELLQAAGIAARGIDLDAGNVAACRAKGLDVIEGDALAYMETLPDGSLDAVLSIQFIEHLPLATLDAFFKVSCRKLKTNGVFIAETVNPYNLAQFRFFYVDPTHQKPIYPEVGQFFARSAGFKDASTLYVPCAGSPELGLDAPWDFCDYAVIANKTAGEPSRQFTRGQRSYPYFSHPYNTAWANERAVEIPVVWDLVGNASGKVLEVGNVLSHYFPVRHDVVDKYEQADKVIAADIADYRTDERYDLIVAISTLEHVGWDEEPRDPAKPLRAIARMQELLNPGGRIALTIPLGYNAELDRLLREDRISFLERTCWKRISSDNKWIEVEWQEIANARYDAPFPCANGLLLLMIGG